MRLQFEGTVEMFDTEAWSYHIPVPSELAQQLIDTPTKRRIVCNFNNNPDHHCALMHDGSGGWVIYLPKRLMKKWQFHHKQPVVVQMRPDASEYGMPIPPEFEEMLHQDPEGSKKFHALSKGKQRSLIYFVSQVKSSEIRIRRSFVVLEHLKNHDKLDGRVLMDEMKEANRAWKEGGV